MTLCGSDEIYAFYPYVILPDESESSRSILRSLGQSIMAPKSRDCWYIDLYMNRNAENRCEKYTLCLEVRVSIDE